VPNNATGNITPPIDALAPVYHLSDDDFRTYLRSRANDGFRGTTIGGSDIGAIMGLSPFATANDVYDRILGINTPRESNAAMRRGVAQESLILQRWINEEVTEGRVWDWQSSVDLPPVILGDIGDECIARASLDAVVIDNDSRRYAVEIKSMGARSFDALGANRYEDTGHIPPSYYAQVQWYLMVSGYAGAYFVAEGPDHTAPLFVEYIVRNDDWILRARNTAVAFWREHVLTRTRPRITATPRNMSRAPNRTRTVVGPETGIPNVIGDTIRVDAPYFGGELEHQTRRAAQALSDAIDRDILDAFVDTNTPDAARTAALVDEAWLAKQVLDRAKAEYEAASEALKQYMEANNWVGAVGNGVSVSRIEGTRTSVDWAAYRRDHPTIAVTEYERATATVSLRFNDTTPRVTRTL
jgi:putative phage-type endonuclease